jgi:hypothetical protein
MAPQHERAFSGLSISRPRIFSRAGSGLGFLRFDRPSPTLFIDDIDGSAADGTVRFSLDGTDYEIDLNTGHAQALRDALARYVSSALRIGSNPRRPARAAAKEGTPGVEPRSDWSELAREESGV